MALNIKPFFPFKHPEVTNVDSPANSDRSLDDSRGLEDSEQRDFTKKSIGENGENLKLLKKEIDEIKKKKKQMLKLVGKIVSGY